VLYLIFQLGLFADKQRDVAPAICFHLVLSSIYKRAENPRPKNIEATFCRDLNLLVLLLDVQEQMF